MYLHSYGAKKGHRRRRSGVALVEFALTCSIFLLLLFGLLEYSRYIALRQIFESAAMRIGRAAAVTVVDSTAEGEAITVDLLNKLDQLTLGYASRLEDQPDGAGGSYPKIQIVAPITGSPDRPWYRATWGQTINVRIRGLFQSATSIVPGLDGLEIRISYTAFREAA